MKTIEEFIKSDNFKTLSEDSFENLFQKAEREKGSRGPKGFATSLGVCCLIAIVTLVANILIQNNSTELLAQENQEEMLFNSFAQENYFDILSDYYPEELLSQE